MWHKCDQQILIYDKIQRTIAAKKSRNQTPTTKWTKQQKKKKKKINADKWHNANNTNFIGTGANERKTIRRQKFIDTFKEIFMWRYWQINMNKYIPLPVFPIYLRNLLADAIHFKNEGKPNKPMKNEWK